MDNSNTLRQQRYAAKKQGEGKRKYGFWLTEKDAELVKVIASDDVETKFGKNIKEMVVDIAQHYKCSPAEAIEMAVARMYLSMNGLDQEYDYPSEEFKAAMECVDDGSPVILSKSVADL
jgi:hypothetical protein